LLAGLEGCILANDSGFAGKKIPDPILIRFQSQGKFLNHLAAFAVLVDLAPKYNTVFHPAVGLLKIGVIL
jgi:hypothetical protein